MKKLLILVCICCFAATAFAQDYIITEAAYQQGKVQRHGKDQLALRKQGLEGYQMIYLKDVKEFKIGNTVYEPLTVNGERNFYARLVTGATNLYSNKRDFALRKDEAVQLLTKKNFRGALASAVPCPGSDQSFSNVTYSKIALSQLVRRSNAGTCDLDRWPYRRFGFYAGYNLLKYEVSDFKTKIRASTNSPTLGIFLDVPFFRAPALYFSGDLSWISARPIMYSATGQNTSYIDLRVNQLVTQLSLKIMIGHGGVSPYLRIGGFGTYGNATSPDGLITTSQSGSTVEITKIPLDGKGTMMFGLQTGAGIELKLNMRKTLHLETRYMKSMATKVNPLEIAYTIFVLTSE